MEKNIYKYVDSPLKGNIHSPNKLHNYHSLLGRIKLLKKAEHFIRKKYASSHQRKGTGLRNKKPGRHARSFIKQLSNTLLSCQSIQATGKVTPDIIQMLKSDRNANKPWGDPGCFPLRLGKAAMGGGSGMSNSGFDIAKIAGN